MIATIKIIPYAVPHNDLHKAIDADTAIATSSSDDASTDTISVLSPISRDAYLLQTRLASTPDALIEKTLQVTGRRLSLRNAQLKSASTCDHDINALAKELQHLMDNSETTNDRAPEWVIVSGASAISDRHDVIPAALQYVGGEVLRFGIPVDPGNLLMLGKLGNRMVIGIPGCARSPKHNGLDLFLDRLACNVPVTDEWINSLAIGGLMDEILERPQPRDRKSASNTITGEHSETTTTNTPPADQSASYGTRSTQSMPNCCVTAIVLAAGQSRRFGTSNKLTADSMGTPVIQRTLENLLKTDIGNLLIVTGHEAEVIKPLCQAVADTSSRDITFVENPDFEAGMSTSLKAAITHILNHQQNFNSSDSDAYGVLVCLGDMPDVSIDTHNALIAAMKIGEENHNAHKPAEQALVFIPTYRGRRGNPILIKSELFDMLLDIEGDIGARQILSEHYAVVREVPVDDSGILMDIDTQDDLRKHTSVSRP